MKASFGSESFQPDNLVAANAHLLHSRQITIKSGQNLTRGAVLGKDGDGKYLLSLSAAVDGSEVPDLILAEDADATDGDVVTIAYSRGDFLESALTIGTAHTAASIREGLRAKGIVLVSG
ncbi:MAG: head decoration protein [Roseovarius sp.]|nr:head decoration protein [Roseovarius sp.]